jgi:hypothetical protein
LENKRIFEVLWTVDASLITAFLSPENKTQKNLENYEHPTSYTELSPKILKIPFGNVLNGFLTI